MKITNNEIVVELPQKVNTGGLAGYAHDNAIDNVESINKPRIVDVEALAEFLYDSDSSQDISQVSWSSIPETGFFKTRYRSLAQHLASNLDKWMVEKK